MFWNCITMQIVSSLTGLSERLVSSGRRIQNLSSYREKGDDFIPPFDTLCEFDMERHMFCRKNLLPFEYSMMINCIYRRSAEGQPYQSHPQTFEEFMRAVEKLPGFGIFRVSEDDSHDRIGGSSLNEALNIFISRVSMKDGESTCIGVIQKKPVRVFRLVLDEIVPSAVQLYNELNPERMLSEELVKKSIETAKKANTIFPIVISEPYFR